MDNLKVVLGVLVAFGFVVLLVLAGREAYKQYRKCVDNGGHFENRNCRTVYDNVCVNYDSNGVCTFHSIVPRTVCDSVCIGASAEAQQ